MGDCVICGIRPAVGKGEHVWPAWFLKDADAAGPPSFGWSSNGKALLNRDDTPLHLAQRQRVLVPACESCNAILNTRFEAPAKKVVRRLVPNSWTGEAEAHEWAAVGQWFAKIFSSLLIHVLCTSTRRSTSTASSESGRPKTLHG